MPFYVWASVIVDGRVVATDYAPDSGWLIPSTGAKPGGTSVLRREDTLPSRLSMTVPNGWTRGPYDAPLERRHRLDFMIVDKPIEWGCDASGTRSSRRSGRRSTIS